MEAFLISMLTGICANISTDIVKKIAKIMLNDANFINSITNIGEDDAKKSILDKLNSITIMANNGEIQINGATLFSLNKISSDHAMGKIVIERTNIHGKSIDVGGAGNGTTAILGGSNLSTNGTRISVGQGCSIRISGNASIKQN